MLIRFLVYGCAGVTSEVIWTGLKGLVSGDAALMGHSSVIMFFIYGMVVFMEPLFTQLKRHPLFLRGIVYMSLIFAVEYWSGLLLLHMNIEVWNYLASPLNIRGVIRMDYAPVWFSAGLFYEFMFKRLKGNTGRQR